MCTEEVWVSLEAMKVVFGSVGWSYAETVQTVGLEKEAQMNRLAGTPEMVRCKLIIWWCIPTHCRYLLQ